MQGFQTFLAEAKNTHMEHIEDNILNGGVDGARESMNFLRALRDMLAGTGKSSVNVSVKWDGAPAILGVGRQALLAGGHSAALHVTVRHVVSGVGCDLQRCSTRTTSNTCTSSHGCLVPVLST